MRIIDKNTDFYDYLQNVYRDDSITFDRTDSYLLTKEMLCGYLYRWLNNPKLHDRSLLLLQVCNTFWLFLSDLTEIDDKNPYCNALPSNYTLELLSTWKNYSKNRELIKLEVISFKFNLDTLIRNRKYGYYFSKYKLDRGKVISKLDSIIQAINTNDYRVESNIHKHTIALGDGSWVEKHIPLLKACGVANLIDPLEIYLAFEEYFSREKTESERTESVGITDKEKIENHGFDTKTSFRGK